MRVVWADGQQLTCDGMLDSQARLLVDQGAVFSCDDPPGRLWPACRPPPVAVLLTLIQACDLAIVIEVDLGASR